MCWACYANNLKAYKAEADINVYKVVKNASKNSVFQNLQVLLIIKIQNHLS